MERAISPVAIIPAGSSQSLACRNGGKRLSLTGTLLHLQASQQLGCFTLSSLSLILSQSLVHTVPFGTKTKMDFKKLRCRILTDTNIWLHGHPETRTEEKWASLSSTILLSLCHALPRVDAVYVHCTQKGVKKWKSHHQGMDFFVTIKPLYIGNQWTWQMRFNRKAKREPHYKSSWILKLGRRDRNMHTGLI